MKRKRRSRRRWMIKKEGVEGRTRRRKSKMRR
jgi:hypothetical protein